METLIELCVKAFTEGQDIFGEETCEETYTENRLTFIPVDPRATYYDESGKVEEGNCRWTMHLPMTVEREGHTEESYGTVGIYLCNGGRSIYFQSGTRVFDVVLTETIELELQRASIRFYMDRIKMLEQNARLKEVEHLIASASIAKDSFQADIDAHDFYIKNGEYPKGYESSLEL